MTTTDPLQDALSSLSLALEKVLAALPNRLCEAEYDVGVPFKCNPPAGHTGNHKDSNPDWIAIINRQKVEADADFLAASYRAERFEDATERLKAALSRVLEQHGCFVRPGQDGLNDVGCGICRSARMVLGTDYERVLR